MHFAFDEDQLEFRAQLRSLLDKECTPADVRHAWASPLGWSPQRWHHLAAMGVVGITVPVEHGGLGLGLVDVVLLLEEAGRAGLPEPLLETTVLGTPLLVDAPGPAAAELRGRWLGPVAAGDAVIAVGTAATATVQGAAGADLLLLEAPADARGRAGAGSALHAVIPDAVSVEEGRALDGSRRPARVSWEPSPATLVASGAAGADLVARLGDRAAMGSAAVLVGVADRLIASAAHYASGRTQFGRPIGSFQAVKHLLADALVRVEFARPAVYRAAWSLWRGEPRASLHASMAKAMASDAAVLAARTALQVHGAIGYTWEHDLHLWMKRAWALAAAWGDAAFHRARVLELLTG